MKFLMGSEKVFLDFLNSINKKDRIAILSHNDLDGIASAIFLEKILESKGLNAPFVDFVDYGVGMFDSPIKELEKNKITKVFLTDINADNSDFEGFDKFRKNFDVLLMDHHPLSPKLKNKKNIVKTQTADCNSWVLYNFGKKFFKVEDWDWLVCAAMVEEFSFINKDNLEFLKTKYKDLKDEDPFNSEPGRISKEISYALKFDKDARKIYNFIKKK